jgi:phosphatidylserine decarboxylase
MITYIDRKTGELKFEKVAGEKSLKWLYNSPIGMNVLELIVKKKIFSYFYGKMQDFTISKGKINDFIKKYEIDETEFKIPKNKYKNFNNFFARELKEEFRPISNELTSLISPCDGRVLAYQKIDKDNLIQVKGVAYKMQELLISEELASKYVNGSCIVIRLCPTDYHRFHFPDSGIPIAPEKIKGSYYSVNPIALNKVAQVYCSNKREITILHSDNFGDVGIIEVGATCVGSIVQTFVPFSKVRRGEEKGYFKFGGSTVILLLKEGTAYIDEDLLRNTQDGIETKVEMGMKIATKLNQ